MYRETIFELGGSDLNKYTNLEKVRALNKETQIGLLFCYKALKRFEDDYQRALEYLMSKEFKESIHIRKSMK